MFAVDIAVSRVARELRVQGQLAFGALQTPDVPAHVDGGQVKTIVDRSAATGATGPGAAVLRVGCQSRAVDILQHVRPQRMTCRHSSRVGFKRSGVHGSSRNDPGTHKKTERVRNGPVRAVEGIRGEGGSNGVRKSSTGDACNEPRELG